MYRGERENIERAHYRHDVLAKARPNDPAGDSELFRAAPKFSPERAAADDDQLRLGDGCGE